MCESNLLTRQASASHMRSSELHQAGLQSHVLAKHLPSCFLMGSKIDHMVPHASGEGMAVCLERCGRWQHGMACLAAGLRAQA